MEQNYVDLELEEGPGAMGNATSISQPDYMTEQARWRPVQERKLGMMEQCWEAQWQGFLKTLQPVHTAQGNPKISKVSPWEDTKAFLASFEQVAEACQWPREEWATRLLPALRGETEQTFQSLEARDREDYGKVKAAILRCEAIKMEAQRQHFRQFYIQEFEDPGSVYSQLRELCHRWLKPETHTKEQILELLILEQFLAVLPVDMQNWIRAVGPDMGSQAVALVEDFLIIQRDVNTENVQEPQQEIFLEPERELDHAERQSYTEARENSGSKVKCPSHFSLSLPSTEQKMAGAELIEHKKQVDVFPCVQTEMNLQETTIPLHVAEQTLTNPTQRTMFWEVLQDDGGSVSSVGDGMGSEIKECGGHKAEATVSVLPEIMQGPRTVTQSAERGDVRKKQIKMENYQEGEAGTEEMSSVSLGISQRTIPVMTKIDEGRCKSERPEKNPGESVTESSGPTDCPKPAAVQTHPVQAEGGKTLFSRSGRKYCCKARLMIPTGNNLFGDPTFEESTQHVCCLEKHQKHFTGEKPFKCPECGKSFTWRSNLLQHQTIHTGERTYQCPECTKGFSCRSRLLIHQKNHTGEKPYQCSECGKCFIRKSDLMKHLKIHTGEKPYKCPLCRKGFTWRSDLLRHNQTHTGEKPYECPQCRKRFTRRSYLLKHQKTHTAEKPYECS